MKWTNDCSIGIPELDEQYKRVIERFAFVREIATKGGGWNDIHLALVTLIKRFEFCSAVEEALMRIDVYPRCERHKKEHASLLLGLRAMENAALTTGLTEEMIGTAFAATMKHHLIHNRHFARYLPQVRGHA